MCLGRVFDNRRTRVMSKQESGLFLETWNILRGETRTCAANYNTVEGPDAMNSLL